MKRTDAHAILIASLGSMLTSAGLHVGVFAGVIPTPLPAQWLFVWLVLPPLTAAIALDERWPVLLASAFGTALAVVTGPIWIPAALDWSRGELPIPPPAARPAAILALQGIAAPVVALFVRAIKGSIARTHSTEIGHCLKAATFRAVGLVVCITLASTPVVLMAVPVVSGRDVSDENREYLLTWLEGLLLTACVALVLAVCTAGALSIMHTRRLRKRGKGEAPFIAS